MSLSSFLLFLSLLFFGLIKLSHAEKIEKSKAKVTCEHGQCFTRLRSQVWLKPLSVGDSRLMKENDVAIGVGKGTKVLVEFSDSSKIYLADSGVLRLKPGTKTASIADSEEGSGPSGGSVAPTQVDEKSKLKYIGNISVRFLSPEFSQPLVFQSFPQKIRIVLEILGDFDSESPAFIQLMKWKVLAQKKEENILFKPISDVKNQRQFSAEYVIKKAGKYSLLASSGDADPIEFDVTGAEHLENQIENLLKNIEENPSGSIEIRGK